MSDQRFLVTARKYRPQRFAELVAQEHVAGTLKNAVRLDRLAHAYLFTGPRGVGKTTAARILAKAINCTTPLDQRDDGAEPCRQCESCRSFEEGRNLNIIEIDAASNNKVDDVRDLRETVRIPPQGNRKKVYIVDEVHMLTTQAFNALLKTLEEPPPHVLFIFATTEPHKVLPTIQSRCQRFDFRRIPVPDTVEQLRSICAAESIRADDGSLVLIARRGDGALRDALSVFDQAVSLCGEDLRLDALVEALGVVSEDLYFEASGYAAGGDSAGMLRLVDDVVRSGYDLQEFLDGLAEHLRNLLVALTMPDTELIEASLETRDRYAQVATSFSEAHLLRLLSVVDRTMEELRVSRQPRLRLELSLLRMATLPSTVDLREALNRLDRLGVTTPMAATPNEGAATTSRPRPAGAAVKSAALDRTEGERRPESRPQPAASTTPKPLAIPLAAIPPAAPPPVPAPSAPVAAAPIPEPAPSTPGPAPTSEPAPSTPGPALFTPGPAPTSEPALFTASSAPPIPASPRDTDEPGMFSRPDEEDDRSIPDEVDDRSRPDEDDDLSMVDDEEDVYVPPPGPSLFDVPPAAPEPPTGTPSSGASGPAAVKPGMAGMLGKPALNIDRPRNDAPKAAATDVMVADPEVVSGEVPDYWETFVARVKELRLHVGALLTHAVPSAGPDGTVVLTVPDEFHARVFRDESGTLVQALSETSGGTVTAFRTSVQKMEADAGTGETPAADPEEALKALCEEYPALRLLMERFGGEIVW